MSMTENEAFKFIGQAVIESGKALEALQSIKSEAERIGKIGKYYANLDNCVKEIEACRVAMKALEEIQAYRAIGTVEDIEKGIKQSEEEFDMLMAYRNIGTIEEFEALKENQRKCEDCAGCTTWKCDCANERDKAIDDFANFIHEKAKENNGLRLSSETRSWTHASIFDYVKEFKDKLDWN